MNQLATAAVSFAPRLASSIVALLSFWAAALVLSAVLGRVGRTTHLSAEVLVLIQRIVKVGVLAFGVVTALGTAGINVSALVAGLGLTGFALGFALKDILSNVLAGVLILMYRPFHRLDRVSVAGFEGTVAQIDLRYTTLEADNRRILIPNSTLFTNVISVEVIQQSSGEDPAAERDPAAGPNALISSTTPFEMAAAMTPRQPEHRTGPVAANSPRPPRGEEGGG